MGKKGSKLAMTLRELRAASIRLARASQVLSASIDTLEEIGTIGLDDPVSLKQVWSVENGVNYIERGAKAVKDRADQLITEKLSSMQQLAHKAHQQRNRKNGAKKT